MAKMWYRRRAPEPVVVEEPKEVKQWYRRNAPPPAHDVTHRAIGDIPGCTPAPRSGTFVNTTLEEAQAETMARAEVWCRAVQAYCDGDYGGNDGEKEMWRNAKKGPELFGAYGETL